MKRMISIISAAIIFGSAVPVYSVNVSSAFDNRFAIESQDVSDDLERAYTLLKQYIASQKKNKNPVFDLARAYSQEEKADENGNIPEQFKGKVIIEHSYSWEETFLETIKDFMEQNNIDENLVVYVVIDDRHYGDNDLYYFGITNMDSFQELQVLDDKGML